MIANKIETNWQSELIQYILANKRKGMYLPYGNFVTKILEHTGFNLKNEEFEENMAKIWEVTLVIIMYEIIDGKIIEKPSKVNKRKMENQETPMNLEDFDYDIPELSSAEGLLKNTIKR